MLFRSDRHFQLWDYNVSHKQMLLRSPASPEVAQNIDIVFWYVEYLDVATTLDGLEIVPTAPEDVVRVVQALRRVVDPANIHCLESGGLRHLVVALAFTVRRNDLDIFESSLDYFGTGPARDLGEVLARSGPAEAWIAPHGG